MNYQQIIDEILLYSKQQFDKDNNGEYVVNIKSLFQHFDRNYPNTDHEAISKMINEIDARGWLLSKDSLTFVFDPATF